MDLIKLGAKCRDLRESLGYIQSDVAEEVGYSKENISAFETGRNNNATILLWYVQHGLTYKEGDANENI